MKEVEEAGFPPLAAFDVWTPELISTFVKKEVEVAIKGEYAHVTPLERETIFATVSAANSCEYCLSFHSMGMGGAGAAPADVDAVINGGLPADAALAGVVTAAKFALSHKGVFLPHEKIHLATTYGIGPDKLVEIVYLVGQIAANNLLMVHVISEGTNVDAMLQPFSPFKESVYKIKPEL